MAVRPMRAEEVRDVGTMMRALWPGAGSYDSGVGRTLVTAVERWCREHGHHELGSDVEFENEASVRAHSARGFEPTLRLQFFRKLLR